MNFCPRCYYPTPDSWRTLFKLEYTCTKCGLDYTHAESLLADKVAELSGITKALARYNPSLSLSNNSLREGNDASFYVHILQSLSEAEVIKGGILASTKKETLPLDHGNSEPWGRLWLTDQRLLFIGPSASTDYFFDHINSISCEASGYISRATISIVSSGEYTRFVIPRGWKPGLFVSDVRAWILERTTPAAEVQSPTDLISQLERLSALHSKGAINDEEFQQAKARLFNEEAGR